MTWIEAFYISPTQTNLYFHTKKAIEPYTVYWTYDNNNMTKHKTKIISSNKKILPLTVVSPSSRRIYFIVVFKSGQTLLCGHRILPVKGLYNLRDMGGYVTNTHKRLKWGLCYRSDYFYYLSDESMEYMQNVSMQTIIDLRSEAEIETKPNRLFGNQKTYICDPAAITARQAGKIQHWQDAKEDMLAYASKEVSKGKTGIENMEKQQRQFVTNAVSKKAFSDMMKIICQKETPPFVIHCRGGKDRTGYGAMLFAGILGVSQEDLVYDYLLTAMARKQKNKVYYKHFIEQTEDVRVADYMYSLFDTRESYILASMQQILQQYASIREYAMAELGITKEEIETMESLYLE